jgi:hypothetical protein
MNHTQPKGNKLFLVCTICGPESQHSLELARRKNAAYEKVMDRRNIEAWFEKHAHPDCGYDHFKLGMHANPDWDKAIPASPDSDVKAAVRLALIKSDVVKI